MIRNYLKVSIENLLKNSFYSAINVFGLAVGIACCLLIGLYVKHELSYDRQYGKAEQIYRVSRDFNPSADSALDLQLAGIAPQAGEILERNFAQIRQSARMFRGNQPVSNQQLTEYERDWWVDPEIFELFDFEWLQGNPDTALTAPGTVVLTQTLAAKYFGDENPMGKTLTAEGTLVRVTGVIRDLPDNTHFDFNMLGSMATLAQNREPGFFDEWSFNSFHTYLLLEDGADVAALAGSSGKQLAGASRLFSFSVTPLTDIHLHSNRDGDMGSPGSYSAVVAFSAIAVFVLLIACFNFMNLSTARAASRAKEVGLRKSIGAERRQIVAQFLGESTLLAAVAVLAALGLAELVLPAFGALMRVQLPVSYLWSPAVLSVLVLLVLTVGLLAGSYPAIYLSAFRSASVLKGDLTRGRGAAVFRRILVIAQFAISTALMIATAVVYLQIDHARNVELGYDREQVLVLGSPQGFGDGWNAMKSELLSYPEIRSVSASSMTPAGGQAPSATTVRYEGGNPEGEGGISLVGIESDFFEAYGIAVRAGRSFTGSVASDRMTIPTETTPQTSASFVLSETAARKFGWTPETAVGKWFEMSLGNRFGLSARGPIVGVVADVNYKSVRDPLEPVFYYFSPQGSPRLTHASIKISGRALAATLDHVERVWKQLMPEQPLALRFVDQDFEALYENEAQQAQMFTTFAVLAIAIACLGLLGLAAYATQRRSREIAVRKIMGSGVMGIVLLLTNDFSKLVLIANVIAWPVAYFAMERWLESFAYRIDLTPLVFIGSGLITLCVAWVTVGSTAAKAANQKPVLALRYE